MGQQDQSQDPDIPQFSDNFTADTQQWPTGTGTAEEGDLVVPPTSTYGPPVPGDGMPADHPGILFLSSSEYVAALERIKKIVAEGRTGEIIDFIVEWAEVWSTDETLVELLSQAQDRIEADE